MKKVVSLAIAILFAASTIPAFAADVCCGKNVKVTLPFQIMADTMDDLKLAYPKPTVDLADIRRKYHGAAKAEKASKKKA